MARASKLWLLSFCTACRLHAAPEAVPADASDDPAAQAAQTAKLPEISSQAMLETIGYLASDELAGRYTLSPEIETAAQWLAKRYEEAGLQAAGEKFIVPYALNTGANETGEQRFVVHPTRGPEQRPERVTFNPLAYSGNGRAKGQAVFVGYAASSDRGEDGAIAYDDLAGVELTGKVAIVLLEAPNQPNFGEVMDFLQARAEAFKQRAGPLVDADDRAGMEKLHQEIREQIAGALRAFMRDAKLPEDYWKPSTLMVKELDVFALMGPVMRQAREFAGPRFSKSARVSSKIERLVDAGAVAVVLVRGPRTFLSEELRQQDALPSLHPSEHGVLPDTLPLPVVQMKWKEAKRLFRLGGLRIDRAQAKIDAELSPQSKALKVEVEVEVALEPEQVEVPNVVARIPGGDLAHELVVFGAHFDHIGTSARGDCNEDVRRKDAICNGADDNASGTAMILELARAMTTSGYKPRRTLVFTSFSGEEMGLLGSEALAAAPPFERDEVVAMVNLDMVGRLKTKGLMIGGIATSSDWMPMLDAIGAQGMEVTYERSSTARSDHANFFKYDIPSLFFFTGTHSDYHRPGDHVDEINVEGLQSIGDLVRDLALELGNGAAIRWATPPENEGLVGRLPGKDESTVEKKVEAVGSAG
jgi:hypothetical protein